MMDLSPVANTVLRILVVSGSIATIIMFVFWIRGRNMPFDRFITWLLGGCILIGFSAVPTALAMLFFAAQRAFSIQRPGLGTVTILGGMLLLVSLFITITKMFRA
jgi:hypothetical protein